jgi:hypothetical protein
MSTTRREEKLIDRTIEETKDSTKKMLQTAKRELPEVTATFHDYQEQNINAIRDMTTTFLESQKEVAKAAQNGYGPLTNNVFTLMFFPWLHPQVMTETYIKAVSNLADSSVAAARLATDLMQVVMDSNRESISLAQNNTKALSRYMVESARAIEEEVRR